MQPKNKMQIETTQSEVLGYTKTDNKFNNHIRTFA